MMYPFTQQISRLREILYYMQNCVASANVSCLCASPVGDICFLGRDIAALHHPLCHYGSNREYEAERSETAPVNSPDKQVEPK